MEELAKKIEELKELMIASNVTHIMIDKYQEWKDKDSDKVVNKFKTSILQDDRGVCYREGYSRPYSEYRRV